MDYSKMKHIEDYDLSKIKDMNDYQERRHLIFSWLGQYNFCTCKAIPRAQRRLDTNRRVKRPQDKCIEHWNNLAIAWEDKINRCLAGEPLESIKGKVKVATSMPASTKHSKNHAKYVAQREKKRAKRRAKRLAEKEVAAND